MSEILPGVEVRVLYDSWPKPPYLPRPPVPPAELTSASKKQKVQSPGLCPETELREASCGFGGGVTAAGGPAPRAAGNVGSAARATLL